MAVSNVVLRPVLVMLRVQALFLPLDFAWRLSKSSKTDTSCARDLLANKTQAQGLTCKFATGDMTEAACNSHYVCSAQSTQRARSTFDGSFKSVHASTICHLCAWKSGACTKSKTPDHRCERDHVEIVADSGELPGCHQAVQPTIGVNSCGEVGPNSTACALHHECDLSHGTYPGRSFTEDGHKPAAWAGKQCSQCEWREKTWLQAEGCVKKQAAPCHDETRRVSVFKTLPEQTVCDKHRGLSLASGGTVCNAPGNVTLSECESRFKCRVHATSVDNDGANRFFFRTPVEHSATLNRDCSSCSFKAGTCHKRGEMPCIEERRLTLAGDYGACAAAGEELVRHCAEGNVDSGRFVCRFGHLNKDFQSSIFRVCYRCKNRRRERECNRETWSAGITGEFSHVVRDA